MLVKVIEVFNLIMCSLDGPCVARLNTLWNRFIIRLETFFAVRQLLKARCATVQVHLGRGFNHEQRKQMSRFLFFFSFFCLDRNVSSISSVCIDGTVSMQLQDDRYIIMVVMIVGFVIRSL